MALVLLKAPAAPERHPCLTGLNVSPPEQYHESVSTLENLLLTKEAYVRPSESSKLAPFDQASQHPMFPAASDCGAPEEFLLAACSKAHPAAELPSLPHDLDSAITFVWRLLDPRAPQSANVASMFCRACRSLSAPSPVFLNHKCPNPHAT